MTEKMLESLYWHSLRVKANQQRIQLQKIISEIQRIKVNGNQQELHTELKRLQANKTKLDQEYAQTIQKLQSMGIDT